MSRTNRHVPHWAKRKSQMELTWIGLGVDRGKTHWTGDDPRDRFHNGYDKHQAMSPVIDYDRWPEYRTGKTRKNVKRHWHKKNRLDSKREMIKDVFDFYEGETE